MPADPDRPPSDDAPRHAEANLAALRQLATASREGQSSWFARMFGSAKSADLALIDALEQQVADFQKTIDTQNTRLSRIERELNELRALADGFRELRGRLGNIEAELVQSREKSDRLEGELRQQNAQLAEQLREQNVQAAEQLRHQNIHWAEQLREAAEKLRHEIAGMSGRLDELRDRIQQVVDEERVSIRQISLKTSEDAVLADRARRALELRLDALEQALQRKTKE